MKTPASYPTFHEEKHLLILLVDQYPGGGRSA